MYVSQYVAYHSPTNFKHSDTFIPERWMGSPEFAQDKRAVAQPFSMGPRNCLGKK
jgi:cytochrome P450